MDEAAFANSHSIAHAAVIAITLPQFVLRILFSSEFLEILMVHSVLTLTAFWCPLHAMGAMLAFRNYRLQSMLFSGNM